MAGAVEPNGVWPSPAVVSLASIGDASEGLPGTGSSSHLLERVAGVTWLQFRIHVCWEEIDHPSGRKIYIVQAHIDGRSRRMIIARHSDMDLAEARRRARELLARIRAGANPAKERRRVRRTPLFRAFAEEYLRRCEPQWKPSGRKTVRLYLKARILPAFGATALDRIGPADVAAWFDAASRDRTGAANRAFEILRAMMFRAEEWGWRERGSNPCLGIAKNARNKVARFLDADELERLGRVLDACSNRWPEAVAAIRLLTLTGCRRSEVLNLRWRNIGGDALNLADTKTGPRTVPLGAAARAHIDTLPGARDPDAFLFERHAEDQGAYSLVACWHTVRERARLGRLLPATPSCPARTCPRSASCSATAAIAPPQAMRTWPTATSS